MKSLQLASGALMPALGLGTWKSKPGEVYDTVIEAVKVGYRHFDCAAAYGNEVEMGKAFHEVITSGLVKREELWVTSKLWNHSHKKSQVGPALEKTLKELQLDYLDLYLIHWPVVHKEGIHYPNSGSEMYSLTEVPLIETWDAMIAQQKAGKAKNIGVSNFSQSKIKEVWNHSGVKPAVNQVESHPFMQQKELFTFCQKEGIIMTAYCPLGSADRPANRKAEAEPILFENEVLQSIAKEKGVTTPQILLAWAVERDTSVIPKTVNPKRLVENLAAADISLSPSQMESISALDKKYRYVSGNFWCHPDNDYTVEKIWG